jgi:hypothetical protein
MSDKIRETKAFAASLEWFWPMASLAVVVGSVMTYGRSAEIHAASGAPLYGKAVQEAMAGLVNLGGATPAQKPPLPDGLSPDEHYWCEQCKAYHKGKAPAAQAPGAVPPVAGGVPAVPPNPAAQPAGEIPPLPEGMSAADHYWCVNCKTYHARQAGQANPAQPNPAAWRGVPFPLVPNLQQ